MFWLRKKKIIFNHTLFLVTSTNSVDKVEIPHLTFYQGLHSCADPNFFLFSVKNFYCINLWCIFQGHFSKGSITIQLCFSVFSENLHAFLFQNQLFWKFRSGNHQSAKQFWSRPGPMFCFFWPDLDLNCLQRLLEDDTSKQKVYSDCF